MGTSGWDQCDGLGLTRRSTAETRMEWAHNAKNCGVIALISAAAPLKPAWNGHHPRDMDALDTVYVPQHR